MGSQCCQRQQDIDEENLNSLGKSTENVGLSNQQNPPESKASQENTKFTTPIDQQDKTKLQNTNPNLYNQYFTNSNTNEQQMQQANLQQYQQQANMPENPYSSQNNVYENKNLENNLIDYNTNADAYANAGNYVAPSEQYNVQGYETGEQINYGADAFVGENNYQYENYQGNDLNNDANNYANFNNGGVNYF